MNDCFGFSPQAAVSLGQAVIVMGVSGSGKSTLAAQLASYLNAEFADADDFHDVAAVEKMRAGIALSDADRAAWLQRLNALLLDRVRAFKRGVGREPIVDSAKVDHSGDHTSTHAASAPEAVARLRSPRPSIILACSALKARYRDVICRDLPSPLIIFLDGDYDTIAARIRERSANTGHYMPETLLRSQFDALERPSDAIAIDVCLSRDAQLRCALESLGWQAGDPL